jgi:hypothetical protein
METRNYADRCCLGPWQNHFIQQNILSIGHQAWQGFSTGGRGLVSCAVDLPTRPVDWRIAVVPYHLQFIPVAQLESFLDPLELDFLTIRDLLPIVRTYQPQQELIVLLAGGGQMEIDWLKNMAIAPQHCYEQVQQRWLEFQVEDTMPWKSG